MKAFRHVGSIAFFIFLASILHAQNQLVLLKGEKVKLRLYPGDDFVYKLKGSNEVISSYINNLSDTSVVAHRDVVPFYNIDRIYFKQSSFRHVVGGLLVVGGAGYFLIDQVNNVIVHGNKADLDEGVARTSGIMLAVGLPMMLIHKKSQKLGGMYRLLMVKKGSPFYKPDLRQIDPLLLQN
jgi:hypothetical protein